MEHAAEGGDSRTTPGREERPGDRDPERPPGGALEGNGERGERDRRDAGDGERGEAEGAVAGEPPREREALDEGEPGTATSADAAPGAGRRRDAGEGVTTRGPVA